MEDLITWDPLVISPTPGVTLEDGFDEETGGESFESIVNVENYEETEVKIEINDYVEDESNVDNCDDAEVKIEIDDNVEEEEEYDESSELPNDEVEEQVNLENFEEAEVKIEINDDLEDLVNVENCEDVEVKKEPNTDVEKKVEVTDANHFQDAESKDSCKVKPGKKRRTSTNERSVSKYHDLYFKEGEEFLCDACNAHYKSLHGVQNHLRTTICGFGQKEGIQKGKHKGLYRKENSEYVCCTCKSRYKSISGIYTHLNTMVCGHGTKKREETRNFKLDLGLYSSEGSQFQCTGCMKRYNSLAGVHKHLETNDECGLRTPQIEEQMKSVKKKPVPTKNFKDLYIKEDGQFICLACEAYYQSIRGIHHHLNKNCKAVKGKHKGLYRKENSEYVCCTCKSRYKSLSGIYTHLNTMVCGHGTKKREEKRNFRDLYIKEDGKFICLVCAANYQSIKGIHYHLNKKSCW